MSENIQNKKQLIFIPQGCYGVITPDTPQHIVGMYTDGLGNCTCLMVTTPTRDMCYLAHIDGFFNFKEQLIEWIKTIKDRAGKCIVTQIHIGDNKGVIPPFEKQIKQIIDNIDGEISLIQHKGAAATAVIFREQQFLTKKILDSQLYKNVELFTPKTEQELRTKVRYKSGTGNTGIGYRITISSLSDSKLNIDILDEEERGKIISNFQYIYLV